MDENANGCAYAALADVRSVSTERHCVRAFSSLMTNRGMSDLYGLRVPGDNFAQLVTIHPVLSGSTARLPSADHLTAEL